MGRVGKGPGPQGLCRRTLGPSLFPWALPCLSCSHPFCSACIFPHCSFPSLLFLSLFLCFSRFCVSGLCFPRFLSSFFGPSLFLRVCFLSTRLLWPAPGAHRLTQDLLTCRVRPPPFSGATGHTQCYKLLPVSSSEEHLFCRPLAFAPTAKAREEVKEIEKEISNLQTRVVRDLPSVSNTNPCCAPSIHSAKCASL